jgi:hypothetical protein
VKPEPLRFVPLAQNVDGIVGHAWRSRDFELITLLVNRAMVAATEQGQVREHSWSTLGPVANVMALTERKPTAREAATFVAVVEHAP